MHDLSGCNIFNPLSTEKKLLITKKLYTDILVFVLQGLKKSHKSFPKDLSSNTERLSSKVSWVDEGNYLPVNVSYQLLAGEASTQNSE